MKVSGQVFVLVLVSALLVLTSSATPRASSSVGCGFLCCSGISTFNFQLRLRGAGQGRSGLTMAAGGGGKEGPINCIESMQALDWDDRLSLQAKWQNPEKGWKVLVEWKQTPYGIGLFAAQDIEPETVIRVGKKGLNIMQFRSADEVETFCKSGEGGDPEYIGRVKYVKDYMFGYNANADKRGYETGPADLGVFMWLPGNGLNHNSVANTVYRSPPGGTDEGINLVALTPIKTGEEMVDDYTRHCKAPQWAIEWGQKHGVSLNWAECNDFVDPKS